MKTLYLLHGIFGNQKEWVMSKRIEQWAKKRIQWLFVRWEIIDSL